MKKFFLIAALVLPLKGLCAQGTPVFDFSNFLQAVILVEETYRQYQTMIDQLRYQYETARDQATMIASADPASFRDAVEFVDSNLTYLRRTESAYENMGIRVGNQIYNLHELYNVPTAALEDTFGREFTDNEKARIWSHYGLKPANYFYLQKLRESSSETYGRAAAHARLEEEGRYSEEMARESGALAEKAGTSDSILAVDQIQANQLAMIQAELSSIRSALDETNKILAAMGQMQLTMFSPAYPLSDDPAKPSNPHAVSGMFMDYWTSR